MMKKILYTFAFATLIAVGCKSSRNNNTEPPVDARGTRISVAVSSIGEQANLQQGYSPVLTRVAGGPGHIMVEIADFDATKLALYGVAEKENTQKWATADRVIDTLEATVSSDGSVVFTKTGEYKYFPQEGLLTLYSIYPSPLVASTPISITDNGVDPVTVSVSVAETFDDQFDILYSKKQNVSVAQAQGITMEYEHLMAQLRFKIMRDADVTGKLTKVVVTGVNKAQMSILNNVLTPSTNPLDSTDYIAYDGVPIEVETEAKLVGVNPLLLIPGQASVSKITITVDGQEYSSYVPNTWKMAQGKINTATLKLNKFGVRINGEWEIQPWSKGDDHSGNLENNGKIIQLSTLMLDGSKNPYTTISPTFVDIEIDGGYTHRGVAVNSILNGVLTTEKFNTGIIHDEPLTLTALKLYTGATYSAATPIFDAKLINGLTLDGKRVIIDTLDGGRIKLERDPSTLENYNINMLFGGFGDGTSALPYEVSNVMTLSNVAHFVGSKTSSLFNGTVALGAHFAQIQDIDLTDVSFDPISVNGISYDGGRYAIRNLTVSSDASTGTGLFASVENANSELRSIRVESGSITYNGSNINAGNVGGIVGSLARGRVVNCVNKATISCRIGQNAGGIAGQISTSAKVIGCANFGQVGGRYQVGGLVGNMNTSCEVSDSYNAGTVVEFTADPNYVFSGLIASLSTNTSNTVENCYTVGTVTTTDVTYAGSVFGFAKSSNRPKFANNYVLAGIHAKIAGTDKSTSGIVSSSVTVKTDDELKAAAMVDALNAGRTGSDAMWKADVTPYINNGYPILIWQ